MVAVNKNRQTVNESPQLGGTAAALAFQLAGVRLVDSF